MCVGIDTSTLAAERNSRIEVAAVVRPRVRLDNQRVRDAWMGFDGYRVDGGFMLLSFQGEGHQSVDGQ
jgi:hypothetical protein